MNISNSENYAKVLRALIKFKSMAFLELSALCDIDEKELEQIVRELERRDLVKVVDEGKIMDEIITVRGRAYREGAPAIAG